MPDWSSVTLGSVTNNFDARRRPVKTTERVAGPYPYYGASGVIDQVEDFIFEGNYLLIAEDGENLRSRSTPIAFLAEGKIWVNNHAHVVQGNELADTRFLSHLLSITDVAGYLTGSTQPKLTRSAMDSIVITIPEIGTQLAIAEVLGALDDKISANNKLAATTDDFLAAWLSSSLREEHDIVRLATIASVNTAPVKPVLGGQIRYIDIAAVGVGMHEVPAAIAWENAPSRARRKVSRGDTLWSTVRPNRRSHSLNLSDDLSLVGSTGLAVLTPTQVGFAYLYEVTKLPEFTTYLETVAEGSAYPAVRADRFGEAQVPLLRESALLAFESMAAPMREYIHRLGEENQSLVAIRDTLLPQLMSGKIRVKDAEKILVGAL